MPLIVTNTITITKKLSHQGSGKHLGQKLGAVVPTRPLQCIITNINSATTTITNVNFAITIINSVITIVTIINSVITTIERMPEKTENCTKS